MANSAKSVTPRRIVKKTVQKKKAGKKCMQKKKSVEKRALAKKKYFLRLYITGSTPRSQHALANIKRICEDYLKDDYELQVIDIYQSPQLAKDERIIATPTLIKMLPSPLRRLIGDFSSEERVLLGLDVKAKTG